MRPFKICLVSSEVAPFAKTGGLADVAAALGRFLARKKHDVRLVMPMYARVRTGAWRFEPIAELQDIAVRLGERRFNFSVSSARLPKSTLDVYFVRCPELYDREGIYTQDGDEHVRFAFLNRAAIEICQRLQWAPDVFHCNDWHTSLIPLYLRTVYAWDKLFANSRTVLTLHNVGYQGVFGADKVDELGLGNERRYLHQDDLRDGRVSFLKTGLLYANAITTVSRTYAQEIQTDEQGMGLQDMLRARRDSLIGIVNGVDYDEWNPKKDALIPHPYSARDLDGKRLNKKALMERLKLPYDPGAPVFGCISRLTYQKGFELLPDILPVLLRREDMRFVVLGNGEEKYENYFKWLQSTFPTKVAFRQGYDESMAHQIEAGADIFVMPSRYEPCGLNQMYSLKYGTVPIVRKTGGLADTVEPFDVATKRGTGFVFERFEPEALYQELRRALGIYRDEALWRTLMQNGMAADFSWDRQGAEYVALYAKLAP